MIIAKDADAKHRKELAPRLLQLCKQLAQRPDANGETYRFEDATNEEDIQSIADIWLIAEKDGIEQWRSPVGMKCRGGNAGLDWNLTAWSEYKGDLPEFKTAGDKLHLYSVGNIHYFILFHSQDILGRGYPPQGFSRIENGWTTKMITSHAGVRLKGPESEGQQGFIYIPRHHATIIAVCNRDDNLEWTFV